MNATTLDWLLRRMPRSRYGSQPTGPRGVPSWLFPDHDQPAELYITWRGILNDGCVSWSTRHSMYRSIAQHALRARRRASAEFLRGANDGGDPATFNEPAIAAPGGHNDCHCMPAQIIMPHSSSWSVTISRRSCDLRQPRWYAGARYDEHRPGRCGHLARPYQRHTSRERLRPIGYVLR